jgi:hypothetical protein
LLTRPSWLISTKAQMFDATFVALPQQPAEGGTKWP